MTFDETKIRRGQPDNAGKFAAKTNRTPTAGLGAEPEPTADQKPWRSLTSGMRYREQPDDGHGPYVFDPRPLDGAERLAAAGYATPEEALAEYEAPRDEDWADAREMTRVEARNQAFPNRPEGDELEGLVDGKYADWMGARAKEFGRMRAAERMFVDGIPHPHEEELEAIWEGRAQGSNEVYAQAQIAGARQMREDLAAGRIRPARIIGTGYKKGITRKLANDYLDRQEAEYTRAIETRGRNLVVNVRNAAYRHKQATADE